MNRRGDGSLGQGTVLRPTYVSLKDAYNAIGQRTVPCPTRAPLEVWSTAVLIRTQDVENAKLSQEDAMLVSQLEIPFSSEEEAARFLFYQDVLLSKEKRCYEIAKSTFLNAVFALLPFGIVYIGLCVRKDKGAEDKKQLAGDSSPA